MQYHESYMKLKFNQQINNIQNLFILNIIVLFLILIIGKGVSLYYIPPKVDSSVLLPIFRGYISPKPFEKALYLFSVVLLPLFSFIYITFKTQSKCSNKSSIIYLNSLPILISLLLFLPLFKSDFIDSIFQGIPIFSAHASITIIICFTITFFIYANESLRNYFQQHDFAINKKIVWLIFIFLNAFLLLSWRVISILAVDQSFTFYGHLDPIMYDVSQVVASKTIGVDLPSQYGMYPELIAPIFRVIKLNILNFTILMAILQIISMTALFFVVSKIVKNKNLLLIGGVSLIVLTFETILYFLGISERYFQYWPLRFFWPALSVFLLYLYLSKKTLVASIIFSISSSISLLWNLDTGLFVFLTYIILLVAKIIVTTYCHKNSRNQRKQLIYALILHLIITTTIVYGFFLTLSIIANHNVNLMSLITYQKIFYKLDFAMLPIPITPHPWMSIIGIYVYGIIVALYGWKKVFSIKNDLLLYLSILGLGLFIYYEGRSHVYNLFSVLWPALIIGLIITDSTLRCLRLKLISYYNAMLPICFISFLIMCCLVFTYKIPNIYTNLIHKIQYRNTPSDVTIQDELNFIKTHIKNHKECLILSLRQGIYYAETGITSGVQGPPLTELLLNSDLELYLNQIKNSPPKCVFIGINQSKYNPSGTFDPLYSAIYTNYRIIDKNKKDTMIFLLHK